MLKINLVAINPENYSLGLSYLEAYIKNHERISKQVEVVSKIFDHNKASDYYYDYSIFIKKITSNNPDVIGFSTFLWSEKIIKQVSKIIKKLFPHIILVYGGPQFMKLNSEWEGYPDDAIFIMGEGEEVLGSLLLSIIEDTSFQDIKGIAFKKDGEWKINIRDEFSDLENIPSPILSGTLKYTTERQWIPSYSTSRGCKYSCAFCNWGDKKGVRFFPLDRVFRELDCMLETIKSLGQIKVIWFTDCIWGVEEKRYIKIMEYLSTWPDNISFGFEMSPDFLTPGLYEALSKINIAWISFGIQSMNSKTLENINRNNNVQLLINGIDNLITYVVDDPKKIHLDLIFGLPGDHVEDTINTINWLKEKYYDVELFFEVFKILPGADIRNTSRVKNCVLHDSNQAYDFVASPEYPFDDMIKIKKIGLGIEFLQLPGSREWARELYNRSSIKYTDLAGYVAEVLGYNDLDYHVEYYRPYWIETQMNRLDVDIYNEIEKHIYKKLRTPAVLA